MVRDPTGPKHSTPQRTMRRRQRRQHAQPSAHARSVRQLTHDTKHTVGVVYVYAAGTHVCGSSKPVEDCLFYC